ncbi:hypothetical protein GCM10009735_75500 [Actinomadura chokoriensis]
MRRNRDPRTGRHRPFHAQRRAAVRRVRSNQDEIRRDAELKEFIQDHLDQRWCPEQIRQVLRTTFPDEPDRHLAHETIYQAIYLPAPQRPESAEPTRCAPSGRPARRRRRVDRRATRFIDPGTLIGQRPADVDDRQVPGHWER